MSRTAVPVPSSDDEFGPPLPKVPESSERSKNVKEDITEEDEWVVKPVGLRFNVFSNFMFWLFIY